MIFCNEETTKFLHSIEINNAKSILDIGCGLGDMTRWMANEFPNASVLGIDADSELIDEAQSRNTSTSKLNNLDYKVVEIENLNELGKSFDIVYCRFVLRHLENSTKILEDIKNILTPNGQCVIIESILNAYICDKYEKTYTDFFDLLKQFYLTQNKDYDYGLYSMGKLKLSGYSTFESKFFLPVLDNYSKKNFTTMTLNSISSFLIEHNLTDKNTVNNLLRDLGKANQDDSALITWGLISLVSGKL
jgi:ubiquinone/menaquinone biosynthesis C-methylase UbiE